MIKKNLLRTATGFMAVVAVTSAMSMGKAGAEVYAADYGITYSVESQTVYSGVGTTVYNGVDYAAVYNCEYYYNNNADVAAAFGYNPEALIAHFVNFGMAEGRCASADFNVVQYMYGRYNTDLRTLYGGDLKQYYYHYIYHGKSEGRSVSDWDDVFDAQYYLSNNSDVYQNIVSRYSSDGNTTGWALWHFFEYGMNEGRTGNAVFDLAYYKSHNPDLVVAFGSDAAAYYTHFIDYGEAEGRQASASFDVNYYKSNNADLVSAFGNNLKAYYEHYIQYGQSEGRLGSGSDTDSNTGSGTDSGNDSTETTSVTVYNGVDYAPVYDYSYYIANNSDLAGMSQEDALAHFVNYGIEEGRQASEDFSVRIYRFENDDVRVVYGDNLAGYVSHYLTNGVNENRNATVIDKDIHFTSADRYRTDGLYDAPDYYYTNFFSKTDKITKLMTNEEIFKQLAYYEYASYLADQYGYDVLGLGNEIEGLVYNSGFRWNMQQSMFGFTDALNACGIRGDGTTGGFGDSEHRISLDYYKAVIDGNEYYTLNPYFLTSTNRILGYSLEWDSFLYWSEEQIDTWVNEHPNALMK